MFATNLPADKTAIPMFNWFWESAALISALAGMLGYAIYWRVQIGERMADLLKVGGLFSCLPVGAALLLSAFKPELTDKLRGFPIQSAILGAGYIMFLIDEITKTSKK